MTDTNFLWENMDNYSRQKDIFIGMSRHQSNAQSLTNAVGILGSQPMFKKFQD
jgi:hypothetical protein